MSHFNVLVFTKEEPTDIVLHKVLAPWHEFECTGINNEYVQDIDITEDALKTYDQYTGRRFKDTEEVMTFGQWAEYYYGYKSYVRTELFRRDFLPEEAKYGYMLINDTGEINRIIKRTNPNAKWDWWVIGGRFSNKFTMKKVEDDPANWTVCNLCYGTGLHNDELGQKAREKDPNYTCNGCNGKGKHLKWPTDWTSEGDQVRLADLDMDMLKQKAISQREEWISSILKASECTREELEVALHLDAASHKEWMEMADPKPRGNDHLQWLRDKGDEGDKLATIKCKCWDLPTLKPEQSLQEWINDAPIIQCFAIVKEGEWLEQGEMGWWGIITNGKDIEEWNTQVEKLLRESDRELWVSSIDCHI